MPHRNATIKKLHSSSSPRYHFPTILSPAMPPGPSAPSPPLALRYHVLLVPGLYNDRTFQVPILKHRQVRFRFTLPRLIIRVFVTSIFYSGRSSARHPTPNPEDQSASLSLGHHLRPVRQGRPYQ